MEQIFQLNSSSILCWLNWEWFWLNLIKNQSICYLIFASYYTLLPPQFSLILRIQWPFASIPCGHICYWSLFRQSTSKLSCKRCLRTQLLISLSNRLTNCTQKFRKNINSKWHPWYLSSLYNTEGHSYRWGNSGRSLRNNSSLTNAKV